MKIRECAGRDCAVASFNLSTLQARRFPEKAPVHFIKGRIRDPRLDKLIEIVLQYNLKLTEKWIKSGVEMLFFGDDLGQQKALPISTASWRHYIKPCFSAIFGLCRTNGVYTCLHTDGHILEIIPDLIECGVNLINPQIRANTLQRTQELLQG